MFIFMLPKDVMSRYKCAVLQCVILVLMTVTIAKAQWVETNDIPYNVGHVFSKINRLRSQYQEPQEESQQQILVNSLLYNGKSVDHTTVTSLLEGVRQLKAGALDVNVSETCFNRTVQYLEGLMNRQYWAIRMFDASAKLPSGVLDGNFRWLGSYSECLAVDAYVQYNVTNPDNTTWTADDQFGGQYCTGYVGIQQPGLPPATLSIGLCVPAGCSNQDLRHLLNAFISILRIKSPLLDKAAFACNKQDRPLNSGAIAVICIAGLVVLCVLIGTIYDIVHQNMGFNHKPLIPYASETKVISNGAASISVDEHTPLIHSQKNVGYSNSENGIMHKILVAFSVYTNGAKVLNTKQASGALTCVNGIRFLSLSWVIWGHTYYFAATVTDNISSVTQDLMKRWTMQVLISGPFSVDSFFVLSGLLVTYLTMREMKKGSGRFRINWGLYYFHRFWRLTPPYMLVLLVYVPTIYYWTNGPMWVSTVDGFDPYCGESWWTNLLYINNVVKSKKMCMGWSWYLANDMQFFVISPLILFPLFWNEIIGVGVLLATLLGSWITTGIVSNVNQLAPGSPNQAGSFDMLYVKPWIRIGPYLIGMLVGYILYVTECKPKLNRLTALIGWMVATATALALVYGLYDVYQGHPLSNDVGAFYNAVSRTAWGACVGWVIYACCTGYGGFVNTLMSWKAFVPLSRLTYCAYLIHPIIMYVVYVGRETLIHATDVTMTYIYFGNIVASFAGAFIVSMVFEAPMMGLEKAILRREKSA
ncbi:nose resistant to fluoxetine protein 6 isoform X2 [Lingula anatina]|uniref:Nose resistant to fluoxetine protein 6 isoform X2 n=1 Tax=Lingula anatina TaxID=7574 RepID=A0A1S3JRB3_LINAN|nr:nose resistant to fluoxetine protein 6 isoform X2 [Lingula anatina]|eukprot:XP_013412631.1 nose resistant to fluoxetine protein 6 isoform X2 [Lingula anatina]